MTNREGLVNLAASVRQRLLNRARNEGRELQNLLSDFAIERFLYRLSKSPHRNQFVLKGATLLRIWVPGEHRGTWDLDLLARSLTAESIPGLVREICDVDSPDGLLFHLESLEAESIRARAEMVGVRVRLLATLAGARIPLQIDFGLGDAVVPPPRREVFPVLLDHPAPNILAYSPEVVVAEKLEAMLTLGVTNSRVKDFYDLYLLASSFEFEGSRVSQAIQATLAGC